MTKVWLRRGMGIAAACCLATAANAQTASPTSIPLQLLHEVPTPSNPNVSDQWRLVVNVGINGGASKPYLFDTGSALFNAVYNPAWWPGFTPNPNANGAPSSSLPTSIQYCYGSSSPCRGYTGNIVQVPTLDFYFSSGTKATSLSAAPGYQINAVYLHTADGNTQHFPAYFSGPDAATPPIEGYLYGTFGAGDFASLLSSKPTDGSSPTTYVAGGVLGQTMVSGAGLVQGYVVAANGQVNPASSTNSPQQTNGQTVMIGGVRQDVTACSPCVTVGLTPQMLGQFAPVGLPGVTGGAGLVPWTISQRSDAPTNFPNPYGTTPGNNSSSEFGVKFDVSLTPARSGSTVAPPASGTLLDTGTGNLTLSQDLNVRSVSDGSAVRNGVRLDATGVTSDGTPVSGLSTSSSVLTNGASPITYNGSFDASSTGTTNTLGISFFLQNSVVFDLSNRAVGYTPFFVTDAALATTVGGPLIVDGTNVPLGLAGVISGPDGLRVDAGGAVQLSATNTYTGVTRIAAASGGFSAGQLYISGPGSITSSSSVVNNGVFDISRAWSPVLIQSLSGAGQVNLGGQNLTILNAADTYFGTMADGGSYPGVGGSLTLAGGDLTLAGASTYTGGTYVAGGTLTLTGSLVGSVAVASGASFVTSGGYSIAQGASLLNAGTVQSLGTPLINQGTFVNNGTLLGDLVSSGSLSGNGTISGALVVQGVIAPGNSIGTLNVGGNFTQATGSTYAAEVNAAGQNDRIVVTGAATLLGGTVVVSPQTGLYAPRTTYSLLTAAGGVTGAYSSVTSPTPFLQPQLSYDANNVYLTLTIGGFGAAAQTPNQQAVGNALDRSAPSATGDFATVVGTLASLSPSQVIPVMNALSGQNYAGFASAGVQSAHLFMNSFAAQMGGRVTGGAPTGSGLTGGSRVALAEACDVACDTTQPALWGAWGGAVGGLGTIGGNGNSGTTTYNVGGFAVGLDRRLTPDFLLGVTMGYSTGTQWVSGFQGSGNTNTVQGGLYGSYTPGPFYVDALAGYAWSSNQMQRLIAIPTLQQRTATATAGANQFFGQLEAGRRLELGGRAEAFLTPFARLQGATSTQSSFAENGAQSLDLNVAAQTTNSLRSVLGATLGGALDLGWRDKLGVQFKLGWSHEYADTSRPVTAAFAGAPAQAFTTCGAAPQRDGVVIGLGANTAVADATSLYLRYEGDITGQDAAHSVTAGIRMTW